ncbi:hypothetical protein V493_07980 [Pseudogymnoascus sp. VKM F-4281 (FW-2241)]|nr:hypothetical protein V493_07980 [Pseudogymnoascus sp. VKM F-4281 (FW-2241)]
MAARDNHSAEACANPEVILNQNSTCRPSHVWLELGVKAALASSILLPTCASISHSGPVHRQQEIALPRLPQGPVAVTMEEFGWLAPLKEQLIPPSIILET